MTLTNQTSIPTATRGQVRAFIKSQPGFEAWISARGIESRHALNRDLLDYAIAHGLEPIVLAIIQGQAANLTNTFSAQTVRDNAQEDENIEAAIMGRKAAVLPSPGESDEGDEASPTWIAGPAGHGMSAPAGAFDLAGVLAPVEPFLSPLVHKELTKALAPLIDAANKPPVHIIEHIPSAAPLSPLPSGAIPYASPKGKAGLGSLFGGFGRGAYGKAQVTTWEAHGAAPQPSPFYVVDPFNMFAFATAVERGSNVWLGGPAGCGKSTLPQEYAAATGRPFVFLSFDRQMDVADMLGGTAVMEDGLTQWQDGKLVQAVKRPGTVIVLDEISTAPAGVLAVFNPLAGETRCYTLPTGEVVRCAPGVVFVAADNTLGFGDDGGNYHGTNAINVSLLNRFSRVIAMDYMSEGDEAKALVNHTGCPLPAAQALAAFVARARKLPEMENMVLSLRQMRSFVFAVLDGLTPKQAAQLTFLNAMPKTERAVLETMFTLTWATDFGNLMSGTASDATPPKPIAPCDSAGARAFDDEVSAGFNR